MYALLLSSIITLISLTHAVPKPDTIATACSNSDTTFWPSTSSAAVPSANANDCSPGGLCDCSRIADKNSDAYFQCVTNPNCERCWVSRSTTSTKSVVPVMNVTRLAVTDYRTMAPGTYTITTNGTVLNIVVTQQVVTPTSSTQVFVTLTQTVVVTLQPAKASSEAKAGVSSAGVGCGGRCDCSKIENKESKEFFECLTNPDCEKCRSTKAAASATATFASNSTLVTTTKTSSATMPTGCPGVCDCSSIANKESEDYFQCVTNPICERCHAGR